MHKWVVVIVAFFAATASAAIPATERAALVALYESTGGPAWTLRTNWLGAAGTECTWAGVVCNGDGTSVAELNLDSNNLDGTLPPEVSALTGLYLFGASDNSIRGPITPLLSLPAVKQIWLSANEITGPLPVDVRNPRTLEILDLGFNPIGGSIPKELADLPNLIAIGLYYTDLTGEIPVEVWRMPSLIELALDGNELTGSIPPDVARMVNLKYLSIGSNQLSGQLPVELTTLPNLIEVWLEFNELTGSIPPQIGQLTDLALLSLYENNFEGPIPTTIGDLRDLEALYLHGNQLTGTIPSQIGSLTNLVALYLGSNQLTGGLPRSMSALTNLQELQLPGNKLSGNIPDWIGGLSELRYLSLDDNDFTGAVPPSLFNLTKLISLGFGVNRVTGALPPSIGNLTDLELLSIHYTSMSGPLPREIGNLTKLEYLFASQSGLRGPMPAEIGNLDALLYLSVSDNDLDGHLPSQIGNLSSVEFLNLGSNRFTGPIPPEIGNLDSVLYLYMQENALRGPIPVEITQLTTLQDKGLFTNQNALTITDPAVRAFIEQKDLFGLDTKQTVTPTNVRVVSTTDRSATIAWDEIDHYSPGGYQVVARQNAGGPAVSVATTRYIFDEEIIVRNLAPETTYTFTVTAITYPSYSQKNLIVSDPAPPVTATTGARVLAPAELEVTETTKGLIQIDGVPRNEDQFTLTNVGDAATNVTLDIEADFATFEPTQFILQGGASQVVKVRSVSRPPGYYYGYVIAEGEGTSDFVTISLFSAEKPAGFVAAEAVNSRVDVAGEPGSDSVGQAHFRNIGTAMLVGILVSDQPWVVPDDGQVFISPGLVGSVTFQVVRSRRPPDAEGALVANLSLVYVDGGNFDGIGAFGNPSPGVSVSKVTIVDVSRPATSSATIPGLQGLTFFLPGITSFLRGQTSFFSDVSILNNSLGGPLRDVRLYYTPATSQQTTVATLSPIPAANSITLANILSTVYQSQSGVGSLQIRSTDAQNLVVQAKLLGLAERGSVVGEVPAFRSDRSISITQELYLTGLRPQSDIYVQETSGFGGEVNIEYLDSEGRRVGDLQLVPVAAWSVAERIDATPAGAVTAVVRNLGPGSVAAYARAFDDTTGDHWSIVDWSRVHAYELGESLRVPFVNGSVSQPPQGSRGRRRAVAHGSSSGAKTDVTMFNPGPDEVAATVEVLDARGSVRHSEQVVLGPRQTRVLSNVGSSVQSAAAHLLIKPLHRGKLVVTARGTRAGMPLVPAASGLRLGRSQIFSNLEDSTAVTVANELPGTYRTTLGLVETSGAPVTVRARIFLDEGRGLASSIIYRDFDVAAGEQLIIENLVRSIVGASRETFFGELHNIQLRIEVMSGSGSIVPFVIVTDNGTNDSLLRLE